MKKDLSIEKSVLINASKNEVWDALTKPERIKKYFFNVEVVSSWEVGSPIIFKGEHEGKSFEDKGTIILKENENVLQYDYWSAFSGLPDKPENYSVVTYSLESKAGQTEVTVTQEGFANEEAKQHADVSWGNVLENLKQLCEQ